MNHHNQPIFEKPVLSKEEVNKYLPIINYAIQMIRVEFSTKVNHGVDDVGLNIKLESLKLIQRVLKLGGNMTYDMGTDFKNLFFCGFEKGDLNDELSVINMGSDEFRDRFLRVLDIISLHFVPKKLDEEKITYDIFLISYITPINDHIKNAKVLGEWTEYFDKLVDLNLYLSRYLFSKYSNGDISFDSMLNNFEEGLMKLADEYYIIIPDNSLLVE